MKKLGIVLGLLIILVAGCTQTPPVPVIETYTVTGHVVDQEGNGIESVQIVWDGGVISTDPEGKFTATGLQGMLKLRPVKDTYIFEPVEIEVSAAAVLSFEGTIKPFEIEFEDPVFEALVRKTIGKPEGCIYNTDVENVTVIEDTLIEYYVSDLRGIEHFKSLEILYLWNSNVADLTPLKDLVNLREIDFAVNRITDLSPIAHLVNLEKLYLARNQISDLTPLSNLKKLTLLELGTNLVKDISVLQGLENLSLLILGANQIEDITSLVLNPGIGIGDYVNISFNSLMEDDPNIQELINRGVYVTYLPQNNQI